MKSVFARISTAIVAVAAVAASALVFAPAASATPSTTGIASISYSNIWSPGGSVSVAMDATRVDFSTQFQHVGMADLVGHTISVNSLNSGLGANKSLYDYAYTTFYNNVDMGYNHQISFPNPCTTQTPRPDTTGVQLNASTTTSCPGVTVPVGTVAMKISYTSAFNGQIYDGYTNVIAAGSTVTSLPRVYDNGTLLTATSVASNATPPASLSYIEGYSSSNVQGPHTSVTIPATGVRSVTMKSVVCVDFTSWHELPTASVFTSTLKNGATATDSNMTSFQWGIPGMFSQYGSTLSTAGGGNATTWEQNNVKLIQAGGSYTDDAPVGGSTYTPVLEVSNGTASVVTSCAPAAPTATGTLSATGGTLNFAPDASFAGKNWSVQVYRNDTNVLVGSGQGSGTNSAMVNGIMNMNAPTTPIPYGVALYAKTGLSQSISDGSGNNASFTSAYSTAKSALFTMTPPVVTFPTNPSGLTTEGKAGIISDSLDFSANVPAMSFMLDASAPGGAGRQPVSDGKNGYWFWSDNITISGNTATGSLKLFHYNQNGVDTAFGGSAGVTLESSPEYTYLRMGWVGDREHWVASVTHDETNYSSGSTTWNDRHYGLDIFTGTMNGTFTKKSYSYTQMDAYCESVYTGSKFKSVSTSVVNTTDSNPWLYISCTNPADSNSVYATRGVYAKSTSAGLATVFAFNNADVSVENVVTVAAGTTYPNASAATDTAVVALFATGKAVTSSQANNNSAPIVKRKLVRITKGGTATVLEGEAAWHEATASTTTSISMNTSMLSLPQLSANGSLLGLMRNGANYAVLDAGATGGFGTVTSADNITYDEVSAPTAFAASSLLAWGRGGSNLVGTGTVPVLTRTGMGQTTGLAQAKLDWATRKVSTQEIISYSSANGTSTNTFVDTNGRLNFSYTSGLSRLGFVRWVGAASLPGGVAVNSQSTSYVINAGGDVVLTGTGLGAASGATKVLTAKVNGVSAVIKARTATTLTITAPANASATAQAPVTGNIELGFADDQGGVVGQLTYVGATKLTPVITQTLDEAPAFFGDADRNFSATVAMTPGQSLNAVTTTSAACSIVGGKVHFVAAGTCTVTSNVAGGNYYNAAVAAVKTITVNKPTATITLNVGDLTAYASDADRTITATSVLDTQGTSPVPTVTATPASVCTIVATKVHFTGAGSCVVKATIASSTAINGDTEQATIVVTKVTPTVTVSVAGATSGLVGDEDRAITVTASAGTATVTSTTPLVCSIVPAVDQSPIKVRFLGAGNCVVKAQVAASATLNASNAALSTAIAVLLADTITTGFAVGDAANAAATEDGAVAPVISTKSGRDVTLTSTTEGVCVVTADNLLWFKQANEDCVITVSTGANTATYAGKSIDWTIRTQPAIGSDANSALQVPNNGVVTRLATTSVTWTGSTNQAKLNLYSKYVGLFKARMTFTPLATIADPNPAPLTCDVKFGSASKVTGAAIKAVKTFTSPAFCTDVAGLSVSQKAAQTVVYNKFKALVLANKTLGLGTSVSVSYQFEKHFANTGALYTNELTLANVNKPWSTASYANLFYLAFDSISATLPAGVTAAVSTDQAGAFNTVATLTSKRTDYTYTSADTDKCEVTSDFRIWAKVAGENCVITVATANNDAVWKAKSFTWTIPMVAAVGAEASSAPIAPSNGTAVNVGPLTFTWTQATSTVIAKINNRNVGLASAKMTFTPLATTLVPNPADITCTVNFGSKTKVTTAVDSIKVQTGAKFCTGADLTKFTALVAARKAGAGQGVIPVTIAYKFESYNPSTGVRIGASALADIPWSPNFFVKLNFRATAN